MTDNLPVPGTLEHTELVWSILPHTTDIVRYVAMNKKTDFLVGDYARNAAELHLAMKEYNVDGTNFYLQMNPTQEMAKIKTNKDDITHWSWFLLDVDPIDTDGYKPSILLDMAIEKLQLEMGHMFFPTIVYSGRGAQAWFRVPDIKLHDSDSLTIDDTGVSRFVARRAMGFWLKHLADRCKLVAGCRIDPCTSDLPRIMRMPGSINFSTGRQAMVLRVGEMNSTLAMDLVNGTPAESFVTPVRAEGGSATMTWQQSLVRLTKKAHDFCLFGKESPGRHEDLWHTLKTMHEIGLSKDEALKGVLNGNRYCTPEPLADEEVNNVLTKIYLDAAD